MKKNINQFQKKKISALNKFFMKNIIINFFILLFLYLLSFVFLFILINFPLIDDGLKISLISMIATFILTTSKSLIEKFLSFISYLFNLLGNEQHGLNKNIGIDVDKVELNDISNENNE